MARHLPQPNGILTAEAKKLHEVQAHDLLEQPGWEIVALKSLHQILRQNHRLVLRRDTSADETQAARGACDAVMTFLTVVYNTAGKPLPTELQAYFD